MLRPDGILGRIAPRAAALLLVPAVLLVAACDSLGPLDPTEATFEPELEVDLGAMTKTDSGLYYRDLEVGEGEEAAAGDSVEVYYRGWLTDGDSFDARESGPPLSFTLGAGLVIAGWDEGLQGMREGGIRQLVIPSHLGYGPSGNGPIPPHAILVFRVELLRVVPPPEA